MNVLQQIGKWIIGGIIVGAISGLAGRVIINIIDGKPIFQKPEQDVTLQFEIVGANNKTA